ncbi:hypothetical protein OIB37_31260 [Streptomyces sp. NBC_00820]|uniref:hypothetical protein n=1 Tax=Streptomyces sp. NBC_00820 TaxID=2975842 RepID=UPI002ED3BD17|nr:hypothetical protein OIB37_31260 [Streptomyces sp. NBC_00820]
MSEGLVEDGSAVCAVTETDRGPAAGRSRYGFEQVSAVADAVLYEGYLLYPYRRSSAKNRVRWQFGVLFPRDWVEQSGPVVVGVSGSADSWYQRTECLLRVRRPDAVVRIRVRYLQLQHKQVEEAGRDGSHRAVASLHTDDGTAHLSFDEAVPREAGLTVPLEDLLRREHTLAVEAPAGTDSEPLPDGIGRVVRRREEVRARTTLVAERLSEDLCRLRVRTVHAGPAPDPRTPRDEALRGALIATHTLLAGEGVDFVSLIDPPAALREDTRACRNEFTFPVLGGAPPTGPAGADGDADGDGDGATGDLLLSAPIILPDHPQVAPESPGDLHDAAEIDEILTLRTMLLTDEEKREARATDPRAAAILDRVDTMPPEVFERLHGAVRSLTPAGPTGPTGLAGPADHTGLTSPADHTGLTSPTGLVGPSGPSGPGNPYGPTSPLAPGLGVGTDLAGPAVPGRPAWWQEGGDDGLSPATDTVLVDGRRVGKGCRVRLRPRGRGADAQDMFLAGRSAQVAAVFHDVDGSTHVAVTVDDDPAAELHTWYGRFHYFRPDELEPIEPAGTPDEP